MIFGQVMLPTMASCTATMMEQWKLGPVAQGHGIDVHTEFKRLTADIIAHTAFGSSYAEGKRVFELQHEQQIIVNKAFNTVYIPGMRYFKKIYLTHIYQAVSVVLWKFK